MKPECSEWMISHMTRRWKFRFWCNTAKQSRDYYEEKLDALFEADFEMEPSAGRVALRIEARLADLKTVGIAACEITDHMGNGLVEYYEWP